MLLLDELLQLPSVPYPVPEELATDFPVHVSYCDTGGSGDCLLRSMYYLLAQQTSSEPVLKTASYYQQFKLPLNTYLEDDHLVTLMALHKFNSLVIRVHGSKHNLIHFDMNYSRTFGFINFYPHHFCPIVGLSLAGSTPVSNHEFVNLLSQGEFTGSLITTKEDPKECALYEAGNRLHFGMLWGEEPIHHEREEVPQVSGIQVSVPISHHDPAILYAFLCDSAEMIFPSVDMLMEVYHHTHNLFVRSLLKENEEGNLFDSSYLKVYYKFRHNVFATLCRAALAPSPYKLETDASLKKYLPDSEKTPDWIIETDGHLILYEFTVGNTYERVDFIKGGGNTDIKYTVESEAISKNCGLICNVKLCPAVLDAWNLDEICSVLGVAEIQGLREFFEISNHHRSVISSNFYKSLGANKVKPPEYKGLNLYKRPANLALVLLPHDMLAALHTEFASILSRLEGAAGSRKKFLVCFDTARCNYYLQESSSGKQADSWLNILVKENSNLLNNLTFFEESKPISVFDIRGTVPVTITKKEKSVKLPQWDVPPSFENVYSLTRPQFPPGYSDPPFFDDSMMYHSEQDLVAFPPDYMQQLSDCKFEGLMDCKSSKMLGNCTMNSAQITEAMGVYESKLKQCNSPQVLRAKPTFLVGLPTVPLTPSNVSVPGEPCNAYLTLGNGNYTKIVLEKALKGLFATSRKSEFNDEAKVLYEAYHRKNSEYYQALMQKCKGVVKLKDMEPEIKKQFLIPHKELRDARQAYHEHLGKSKAVIQDRLVRVVCTGTNREKFDQEMLHYNRNERSSGLGLGDDIDAVTLYFKGLCERMVQKDFTEYSAPPVYEPPGEIGSPFLNKLKKEHWERWEILWGRLRYSLIFQCSVFLERFSKFIFNESLKNYNKDYVKIDNLGYKEILVMVKGGSKLYKHQRSKLYRLMFPLSELDYRYSGYKENLSFESIRVEGKLYIMTPWSQIHQDVLFDYMFAPYRVFNQLFSVCARMGELENAEIPSLAVLPSLLMFHNRRKTEKFLHNSRYLIVNPLGLNANLTGIMESFCDMNYTWLEVWLRGRLLENYQAFAESFMALRDSKQRKLDSLLDSLKLKDLWLGEPLVKPDLLTLFIYSTYMMTKAPVNSSIEQASNLWEILEDKLEFDKNHGAVDGLDDESLRFDVLKFDEEVYQDDYKYDPVFCQYLGHYMASYLSGSVSGAELHNKWDSLYNQDIDRVANSNGLRGWNNSNFFNHKGYEIVYGKIDELLDNDDIAERVESYLNTAHLNSSVNIQNDKVTLQDLKPQYENLCFHIVHKIQRGGNREIFCMDLNTKALQNPIENFFAHLCKKVPNEFISIPSSKRHAKIHSDFYEKKISRWVKKVVRWVLDCRRWAPHSVFQKYTHFVTGMSQILPNGFLQHFYKFTEGMFKKQFITREHVISKMKNNKRYEPYKNLMKPFNDIAGAFSMTVQFSFVMGIFNYLSTLMHAANQLVASEVIRQQCLNRGLGLVIMDAKCHSDDSVVSSYHEDSKSINVSVKLYDWLLKGANHMLSVKKSQVNEDVYLEFLSTLYVFDRFLPVFPKFISTIPFKPTDEGLMSDVSFAASQALEMLTMGGTFEESYLIMKTTDKAIRRIYNVPSIPGLPPQLFGAIDAHPMELLFSGSEADLHNFYIYENEKFWQVYQTMAKHNLLDLNKSSFSFEWDMGAMLSNKIRLKLKALEKPLELLKDAEWTLNNCKMGNSTLNLLWYYLKLNDRKFRSSLLDEPPARRMARIFGSASYRSIKGTAGNLLGVSKVVAILKEQLIDTKNYEFPTQPDRYLSFMSSGLRDLHEALQDSEIVGKEFSNIKEKPITLITGHTKIGNGKLSSSEFVSYLKEPKGYKLLGKFKNPHREVKRLKEDFHFLGIDSEEMPPDLLYKISNRLLNSGSRVFRMVSSVPSGLRLIQTHVSYLKYLESNTFPHVRLMVKNTTASAIDWNKKLISGKVPKGAREYMQHWWTCKTLSEYNILDKDIYIEDPIFKERTLASQLPDEWKLILLTSTSWESLPLSEVNHWCYWEKEQLRMGSTWVGHGACVVKLPEAVIRLEMAGGVCNRIQVYSEHIGFFSQSSSWYLHNVLRHNSVNSQYLDSALGSPNSMYLGMDTISTNYGIGRSGNFDVILEVEWLDIEPFPIDFKKVLPFKRKYGHYTFFGENNYYIDFFVPTEDPSRVSFRGLFDMEKLKSYTEDSDVLGFIKKISIDAGGLMEFDKEWFIRNLGSTTLYRLIYESSERTKLMSNEPIQSYLPNAFEEWKKTHPDFGYPDEEEFKEILKNEDAPPFPQAIMQHLLRIGKSNITDREFSSILTQLSSLEKEDRYQYLASNYGYMDQSMRIDSLVLASRSRLIYKTISRVGIHALRILVPYATLFGSMLETNGLRLKTIEHLRSTIYYSKRKKYSPREVWNWAIAKALQDAMMTQGIYRRISSFQRIHNIVEEAYHLGAGILLNTTGTGDPLMRTVDFNVPIDMVKDFLFDLFHGVNIYNYRHGKSYNSRTVMSSIPPEASPINEFMAKIVRLSVYAQRPSLKVSTRNTQMILKDSEPVWGRLFGSFYPVDLDNQEEIEFALQTEDYEGIEDLEEDEDADIPEFGFACVDVGDLKQLSSVRGIAHRVFARCVKLDTSIKMITDQKVVIFKKKPSYNDMPSLLEVDDDYIVYIGNDSIHCQIEGYQELNFEALVKEMQPKYQHIRHIRIDNKDYVWEEVLKKPTLLNQLVGAEQYFKNVSLETLEELSEEIVSLKEHVEPHNKEIEDMIQWIKNKKMEKAEDVKEFTFEDINLSEIFLEYQAALAKGEDSSVSVKEYMRANYSSFRFSEPLRVLEDMVVRSELNAFIPGKLDLLLNKEVQLSKKTKSRIIKFAQLSIQTLPRDLRKIYNRVLLVVRAILAEVKECNYLQNETLELASLLDGLFSDAGEVNSGEDEEFDLIPDTTEDLVKFDLGKLLS